jgi:hypothetical protein
MYGCDPEPKQAIENIMIAGKNRVKKDLAFIIMLLSSL